jgi:predicted enzyme related to lactoylglutathione lyase
MLAKVCNPKEEAMTSGMKTVMYPVKDIAAARKLYGQLLGIEPYMDEAYYVGFNVDGQDVGLDPNGHRKGLTVPQGYWHVDDIQTALQTLLDGGATAGQPVKDVGGGKLIATVVDPDGNTIGLLQL